MKQGFECICHLTDLIWPDPRLLNLVTHVNLDIHRHHLVQLRATTVNLACNSLTINRLYDVEKLDRRADLIRLKVTHQVPLDSIASYCRDLVYRLLYPVLAEEPLSGSKRLLNDLSRKGFRDSQKLYAGGVPAA